MTATLIFRLLHHDDKGVALAEQIEALGQGRTAADTYAVNPDSFCQVPNTPFCYWVSDRIRRLFRELPPFEGEGRTVRVGLQTGDDFRFVRLWWEVPTERVLDGRRFAAGSEKAVGSVKAVDSRQYAEGSRQYAEGSRQYAEGSEKAGWSEEELREFQAWCRQQTHQGKGWVPFAKGGEYSPYYADIHLVVNWARDGAEIRNFIDTATGKLNSRPQNTDYYFRPGLTWGDRTSSFLSVRTWPAGGIFSVKGSAGFFKELSILFICALMNSILFNRFLEMLVNAGSAVSRSYQVGIIGLAPFPDGKLQITPFDKKFLVAWIIKYRQNMVDETSHAFTVPAGMQAGEASLAARASAWQQHRQAAQAELARLQVEIDEIAFDLYEFTAVERQALGRGGERDAAQPELGHEEEHTPFPSLGLGTSTTAELSELAANLISYGLGAAFGRWDLRLALDPFLEPPLPDPFDPLPVCPPGMLIGPDGLPARPGHIVSETWLKKRAEGSMQYADGFWRLPEGDTSLPPALCLLPTDSDYPIRITWSGILPDDPTHPDDLSRRLREVLDVLWGDKAHAIEQEACDILGVKDLRDYFRRPAGFFADHLQRYSKSRRKAPIYWPLSTASESYTLWLYYHRLTDQTLYTCVQDYVNPKLAEVDQEIDRLQQDLAQGGNASQRQKLESLQNFAQELRDFREELLRVAALPYKPNLNDGVLITAAPLWKLFRLPKWRKDLEDCWKKLVAGDYDWAHLAYSIWPDRVKEKCKTDKSLAIAHDQEELYVEPPTTPKRGRRKKKESP